MVVVGGGCSCGRRRGVGLQEVYMSQMFSHCPNRSTCSRRQFLRRENATPLTSPVLMTSLLSHFFFFYSVRCECAPFSRQNINKTHVHCLCSVRPVFYPRCNAGSEVLLSLKIRLLAAVTDRTVLKQGCAMWCHTSPFPGEVAPLEKNE